MRLEESKGGKIPPAVDEDEVSHEDLGPSAGAAIWGGW
jgi:hypothetical protein